MFRKSISQWLLWFSLLGITRVLAATACLPQNQAQSGFTAKFYQYDFGDTITYSNPAYMAGGYTQRQLLGTKTNLNNILIAYGMKCRLWNGEVVTPKEPWNFDYSKCVNTDYIYQQQKGTIFGLNLYATDFTVELTGYFLAPQNGTYTFALSHVDDSAILSFGEGIAFDCCNQDDGANGNTNFSINAIKPNNGPTGHMNIDVELAANYYYPLKIVFTNTEQIAMLYTTVTLPDGTIVANDFNGYVFSFDSDPQQPSCTVINPLPFVTTTSTIPWTGSFTSSYTTETKIVTDSHGDGEGQVVVGVETPTTPPVLTTEYTPYSGSVTSTYSTESTWVTGTDGKTTPETIYHVETPTTPPVLTTEYTGNSGNATSTYSTESTWVTGTDGKTTPETIYHVETPTTPPVLTTEYTGYSGNITSTYSTESTYVTGTDGKTTPETIYHVETPTTPPVLSTSFTGYNGNGTSTFSTESTWVTGTDGKTTPETIYHVETPTIPPVLTTEYTGYNGNITSTYSTESTWVTGTDGKTTPETIYHVETPTIPPVLSTSFTGYNGNETSTYSTESTWVTGTDGKTTPETIYHVETPTIPPVLTTEYTGYNGNGTSTFSTESTWVTGTDGKTTPETIYHVETPTAPANVSSPTGVLTTEYSPYPGDSTSTFSTETTWFTGTDGKTTPETIYHVRTPISTSTIRTPHSWSGGNKTSSTGGKTYYTTTTDIVTTFTTYCPYPTTLTTKSQTFTVTQPTTLTITCTNSGVTQILPVSQTTSSNWQDTVNPQATSTNGASHQDASTQQSNGGSPATFTSFATSTEIVTALTTYCPGPTVLTTNGATYTVTEATTLTVTDCPCTRTHTSTITGTIDANTPAATALATGGSSNNGNNNNNGEQDGAQGNSVVVTSTEVVETLTTYCSDYTVLSTNGAVYTVTAPTTLTITDCPCTLTHTSTVSSAQPTNGPAATGFTTTKPYPFSAAGFGYTNKTQTLSELTFNNGSTVLTTIYGGNSSSTATTSSPLSISSSSSPYTEQSVSSKNGNEIIVTQVNTVTANVDGSLITESTEIPTTTAVASDVTVTEASTAFATMIPSQSAFAKRDFNDNTRISVTISSDAASSLTSHSLIAILGFLFMIL